MCQVAAPNPALRHAFDDNKFRERRGSRMRQRPWFTSPSEGGSLLAPVWTCAQPGSSRPRGGFQPGWWPSPAGGGQEELPECSPSMLRNPRRRGPSLQEAADPANTGHRARPREPIPRRADPAAVGRSPRRTSGPGRPRPISAAPPRREAWPQLPAPIGWARSSPRLGETRSGGRLGSAAHARSVTPA